MAGPIVKSLHVLKDRRFGLPAESKTGAPWNTIPFSAWQEPLHHGIGPNKSGEDQADTNLVEQTEFKLKRLLPELKLHWFIGFRII